MDESGIAAGGAFIGLVVIALMGVLSLLWLLIPLFLWFICAKLDGISRTLHNIARQQAPRPVAKPAPPPAELPGATRRKYRVTGTDKTGGLSALTIRAESEQSARSFAESKGIRVQAVGPAI